MSVVSRPRRVVPPIAIAALLLVSGCVSAFTNGAGDWTPADGEPHCTGAELGLAADIVLLAVGASTAPTLLAGGAYFCESPGCAAFMLSSAFFVAGGPTVGVIGGAQKTRSCHRAKAGWRTHQEHGDEPDREAPVRDDGVTRAIQIGTLRRAISDDTGATVDIYGDTVVLHAATVDLCTTSDWFQQVHAHRDALVELGVTHASCRVGRLSIWDGQLR
jgi:hypothetical protein